MLETTFNHLVVTGRKIMNRQPKHESELPTWWRTKWEIDDWEESVTYVKAVLRVFLDLLTAKDKQPIGEIFCAEDDAVNSYPDILIEHGADEIPEIVIYFNRMSVTADIVEALSKQGIYKVESMKDDIVGVHIGTDIQGGAELISRLLLSRKEQPACQAERECYLFNNETGLKHFHEYFKRVSL